MKQLRIYLLALMGIMVLAACGGGDDPVTSGGSGGSSGGGGGTPVPQTYTQSLTIKAEGGEQTVTLHNLSSAVSSVGSTPDWLIVSPQFYSSGAPTILLVAQENTETSERKCDITLTASSGDKVILSVTQQAASGGGGGTGGGSGNDIDDVHNDQTDQPAYAPMH